MRRALTLSACLLLAACSSSGGKPGAAGPAAPTASPTSTPSASASASAASSAGPTATGGPSSRASAAGGASASPTRTGGPAATAPKGAAPGSYPYDTSGSVTYGTTTQHPGNATLTIGAVTNGAQTSTLHNDEGDTTEAMVLRPTGTYLSDLKVTSLAGTEEFRIAPAALLFPDPPRVGMSWSWSAQSTDGKSTATTSNKVLRTETLTIGGQQVATVVLQTHLVLSGSFDYTADVTTWVAPSYHLPVKDHTVGKGTYGAFGFTTDITDVMRSLRPS